MAEEDNVDGEEVGPEVGTGTFSFGNPEVAITSTYEGEWKLLDDGTRVRHGQGKQNGAESYDGAWVDGKMHGRGKYSFASGSRYVGNFSDNRMQGRGKYTWPNGSTYEGNWVDNRYVTM